ncbi:hypothetical protein H4683_002384 [Filibacter limicola]|uniref:Uncharacterized protein n=1 Tax=Sporosarcina limicola TaxID=34101 RepID=A0A927MPQ8_9BACL|nr:hypothetical protein [Sporosarcina limicola]
MRFIMGWLSECLIGGMTSEIGGMRFWALFCGFGEGLQF